MLNSVQKARLDKAIREIKIGPGWRDIRRFMIAAASEESPTELDDVAVEIEEAMVNAVVEEKQMARKSKQ